ncbi:sugar transferase [Pseudomonas daroniae]|uniref:Sugar transferase n=1 Tax=Phytopseudomonas daroniae TaxID=2487519 RepID=A0A4Q9QPK9_9GAMM|nr:MULTISPECIES: sugar transferase [Pseudomonas]TBU82179.1 sugar transferase [Pseudomonas daroniae]TBU84769.1 sugar transferase [Pseudomonas sp. FRB 228]TBU92481.1 sugar transferase [Pseudomonas daroniae]
MKRIFDSCFAMLLLAVFFPLYIVLAGLVFLDLGRPVFFCQRRPGYQGQPITVYKFRTMHELGADGLLGVGDAERMTRVGRFLRSTSLDELPQLWNVLKGDMSLVGPRPLLMDYLPLYNERQMRRHDVKPGITGWAQVNGRNNLSWQEKFELDIWYVENHSFWLDLKILCLTVSKVFKREGISSQEHVTSVRFEGNDE